MNFLRYFTSFLFSLFILLSFSAQGASLKKAKSVGGDSSKGNILFNHFCASCHGVTGKGNGINAVNLDPSPADLTSSGMAKLTDGEIFEIIEKGGAAGGLSILMPPWGKTLSRDQIGHLVAYIRALSGESRAAEPGTVRFNGTERVGEADCRICHQQHVVHGAIAPNLGHEGTKLNREWLFSFLKKPHKIRPIGFIPLTKTTMPNFYFKDEEADALTEYLMTLRDAGISKKNLEDLKFTQEEIDRGKKYFSDKFACDACHRIGAEGGIVGPNLKEASQRLRPEWMFQWLKSPQGIRPDSPMPNFGLSDEEARALIAYILGNGEGGHPQASSTGIEKSPDTEPVKIKKGEALLKEKNCVGCHSLDSFNSKERKHQDVLEVLSMR
ncbi:MAG: c-type cytochrome [Nitrospiria bacterium]